MSVCAKISVKVSDTEYRSVYCNWGELQETGHLLLNYYNTNRAVKALLYLGDISRLTKSIEKPEGHSALDPVEGYSIFYSRDYMNMDYAKATISKSMEALIFEYKDTPFKLHYLFMNNKWIISVDKDSYVWTPLKEALGLI